MDPARTRTSAPRARDLGPWIVLACALAYAVPLAGSRYFPGLDLPWHAAIVSVMHEGGGEHFLGVFSVEAQFSSYLTLYLLVDGLSYAVGDVVVAMQVVTAAYVVGFVWAARRLLRAFDGEGALAVLAAPAAYSVTMEFGFLSYALCFPLTFWLWALARELGASTRPVRVVLLMLALSALIALTHPFAAAVAAVGVVIIASMHASWRRTSIALAVLVAGCAPAVLAVTVLAGDNSPAAVPMAQHDVGLWGKVMSQDFVAPLESMSTAPVRLFGFVPEWWRFVLVAVGLVAAVWARGRAGAPQTTTPRSRRCIAYLLLALAAIYLVTPYTFHWPRQWYGAQPRLLPALWVVALVALRSRAGAPLRTAAAPIAVSAAALGMLIATSLLPFHREAGDFRAVVAASAPRARTIGLIEQPWAYWRTPPSPWRHAPAWLMAERGGYVSNLVFADSASGNAGVIVPVRVRGDAPALPVSPPAGRARWFSWDVHAAGWEQFLIRDADPSRPHDYFAGHEDEVELVVRSGRWRLYRRAP